MCSSLDSGAGGRRIVPIIVNYNSSGDALGLARAFQEEGLNDIIIVDNNSHDSARSELQSYSRRQRNIHLVALSENLGFGAAVNLGFHCAEQRVKSFESLLVCNTDIQVQPGFAHSMARHLKEREGAIVSPRILTRHRARPVYWYRGGHVSQSMGYLVHRGKNRRIKEREKGVLAVSFAPATCLLVPRDVFKTLDGLREDFFLYWEDAEFCIRAANSSVRLYCDLETTVFHEVGGSARKSYSNQRSVDYYYYMNRNRFLLRDQETPAAAYVLGPGFLFVMKLVLNVLIFDNYEWRLKLGASWEGIVDGIKGLSGRRI